MSDLAQRPGGPRPAASRRRWRLRAPSGGASRLSRVAKVVDEPRLVADSPRGRCAGSLRGRRSPTSQPSSGTRPPLSGSAPPASGSLSGGRTPACSPRLRGSSSRLFITHLPGTTMVLITVVTVAARYPRLFFASASSSAPVQARALHEPDYTAEEKKKSTYTRLRAPTSCCRPSST